MKKKLTLWGIAAAVLVAAAVIVIIAVTSTSTREKAAVDLYFINEHNSAIVAEPREIRYKNDYELVEDIIEGMRKGPMAAKNNRSLPRGVRVYGISFDDEESLTIDLTEGFSKFNTDKSLLPMYAVTKSICSAGIVKRVRITENGADITDTAGGTVGYITGEDINLENEEYQSEMRDVTLYFANSDGTALRRETRTIKITDRLPMEQYIINELVKGPKSKDMQRILSKKTALVSVALEDNICYLNFRAEFLSDNAGDSTHNKLVIYSIVNSLSELDTISRVQFYMDGKREEKFGDFAIKDCISRNTNVIETED